MTLKVKGSIKDGIKNIAEYKEYIIRRRSQNLSVSVWAYCYSFFCAVSFEYISNNLATHSDSVIFVEKP